jgi:integrase
LSGQCPVRKDDNTTNITRETLIKIGVKDITRAWKDRRPGARHIMTDKRCAGLMLITGATSQTWAVEYRPRGVDPVTGGRFPMKSVTIGTPASHSPDEALAKALQAKGSAKIGGDPAAERQAAIVEAATQRASTVERAAARYLEILPTGQKKGGGRISTGWAKEQASHLRRAIAALGVASSSLASIDVKTVRKLRRGVAYRHRFGSFSRFLDWCVHEDLIPVNPCASIGRAFRPKAGGKRERTPSLRDLALIWAATEKALEETFRDFVRFAICIPARRGEIATMDWRHVDLEARVWRQPGRLTKNREPHELYLHDLALEILSRRWEATGRPKTGLVFPSPRTATPITAFSAMLRALHREAEDVEAWSLHDCRRSFASTLGRLGEFDDATIDGVLNHRQTATRGGVLGTYNRSTRLPAQAEALERWGRLLADALEGRFPEKAEAIPVARRARI